MQVMQLTCENCAKSMIRDFHGTTTLYCGRFNKCLSEGCAACDLWTDSNHRTPYRIK